MRRLPRLLAIPALLLLAACKEKDDRPPNLAGQARDSIRARQARAFAMRPDTAGLRVDSLRIAGDPAAPGWIIVTSDFQCEACRRFARQELPTIRRELVETGQARLAFVNLPGETRFNARFAAHAALCAASEGRFWEMHDVLFERLPQWDTLPDPQPFLDSLGLEVGVTVDEMASCRERQRFLPLLTRDIERSRAAGVDETPTVFVGDRRLSGKALTAQGVRDALGASGNK